MARTVDRIEVIERAAEAFQQQTGVSMTAISPSDQQGGVIHLWREGETWDLHADVRPWLNPQHIELLRLTKWKDRTILVTRYVNPPQAEILRSLKIPYIDTAGNCYLNLSGLQVQVAGKRGEKRIRANRSWEFYRPAELRVLFALLSVDGLESKTHHAIREFSGASIGTINHLFQLLGEEEFITRLPGKPRKLEGKRELVERWVAAYPHGLRQKLHLGTFTTSHKTLWESLNPAQFNAQWGGEVAAMNMSRHVTPGRVTIYAERIPTELIEKGDLRENPRGEVEIIRRFWGFNGENNLVPPLLVYADLLATHDKENIDAARLIYEEYLARSF